MEMQFYEDLKKFIFGNSKEYEPGVFKVKVKNKGITYQLSCHKSVSRAGWYVDITRVNYEYDVSVRVSTYTLGKLPNFETLEQVFDFERELYEAKEKEELERKRRLDIMLENVTIVE
ncbi:hypothetical protein HOR18_gp190 [Staphylococcus phage vB_SscM-1]|uniref:Uncharacterized protein n=2 Tax=Sciuriunavirus SscM1 TaxID=2734053 RepID=A0A1X9I9Y5_9CAUD|nr:hypothetical protein HOR18_gp190 [Staphylococcus phage vB_SscM-1]ANT44853.1 hypothetical protein vB_SscM-1_189 [Staphylococcus phage vB_SscM-1]ANT45055.1 hypothetical protein vB_SscM-2_188 [Staphylococcus phage vB_SscM-2]